MLLLLKLIKPLILVTVLAGAYFLAPTIGDVNGKTLHVGVVNELGGERELGSKQCAKRGSVTWRCTLYGKGASDPTTYTVRVRDGHCWNARRITGFTAVGDALDPRASGCLHLRDQVRGLIDR